MVFSGSPVGRGEAEYVRYPAADETASPQAKVELVHDQRLTLPLRLRDRASSCHFRYPILILNSH